jgi:hypothetical protein
VSGWIKMGVHLRTHPKVVRMASALKADRLRVVGGLWAVWCVFDAHSVDGHLPGYSLAAMDEEIGWKGFGRAMSDIGWLIEQDDGLQAPEYEDHNGASAKRRATETKRKADSRGAVDARTKAERVADWKQTKSGQMSAPDADKKRARGEERREEEEIQQPTVAPARPPVEQPATLALVQKPTGPPDCPHAEVLTLWAEVLPAMPQHLPSQWRGSRADHLRARWRETAVEKGWTEREQGLAFLRKLFTYVGQSAFLTGRSTPRDPSKRPFVIELEWLVNPSNWAKVIEGKYHQEAA